MTYCNTSRTEELLARIAELEDENRELRSLDAARTDDPEWDDRDDAYRPGCGEYDSYDSKGRPLLSRFNEAGEWRGF